MEELIQYFKTLEERIATLQTEVAALQAEVTELKNRPAPEPQIVEKVVERIVEKPVEKIVEKIVEKPVIVPAPVEEVKPQPEPEPVVVPEPEPQPEPQPEVVEIPKVEVSIEVEPAPAGSVVEPTNPNAAKYGKPVDDIRQAISLGDRFLYQRELFGQNAELMQKTLTDLNALRSFDEAISYIMTHFQWDADSSTYQQFLVTLHRRFG